MKKDARTQSRRRRAGGPVVRLLKWSAALGVIALVLYGVSQSGGVAYTEKNIGVVNFSDLTPDEKRTALEAANGARCTCGCGMTLAQCVSTDMTCPVREDNIQRIRTMVREADKP